MERDSIVTLVSLWMDDGHEFDALLIISHHAHSENGFWEKGWCLVTMERHCI
jgi:hypothetical protein